MDGTPVDAGNRSDPDVELNGTDRASVDEHPRSPAKTRYLCAAVGVEHESAGTAVAPRWRPGVRATGGSFGPDRPSTTTCVAWLRPC